MVILEGRGLRWWSRCSKHMSRHCREIEGVYVVVID